VGHCSFTIIFPTIWYSLSLLLHSASDFLFTFCSAAKGLVFHTLASLQNSYSNLFVTGAISVSLCSEMRWGGGGGHQYSSAVKTILKLSYSNYLIKCCDFVNLLKFHYPLCSEWGPSTDAAFRRAPMLHFSRQNSI